MSDTDDIKDLSFEEALEALEGVVTRLESGNTPLEESISLYTRGTALKAHCEERLKTASMKIEKLTLSSEGAPVGAEPFGDEG